MTIPCAAPALPPPEMAQRERRDGDRPERPSRLTRYDARSAIAYSGERAELRSLRQESPMRFLRPDAEPGDATPVVLANTAGGIVGGDRLALSVEARGKAQLLVTGQAAEKVYRSQGEDANVHFSFTSSEGAVLEVLPQGTILFDGARLRRRTLLSADEDATLLYGEILYFGRGAMDEAFDSGRLHDRTEVWRAGQPTLTDVLRLDGDLNETFRARAGLDGARACAVAYLVHPEPGRFLAGARAQLSSNLSGPVRAAAGVHDGGPLVVRWLSEDAAALRKNFGSLWTHLRSSVLARPARTPRIWSI